MSNYKQSKESIQKRVISRRKNGWFKNLEKTKMNMTNAKKGNTNTKGKHWKMSEKGKKNISNATIGEKNPMYGKRHSKKTKKKQREGTVNYIKKISGDIWPRIGKNEKKILDSLEKEINYKIDRKFTIEGYFPDGYIHELNLIIEVDERPKTLEKDVQREQNIKKALNCEFLRIKDYD